VFAEEAKGPVLREFCADLHQAKRKAQEGADREGLTFLIFSFAESRQLGSFPPSPKKPPTA
jgi:hypothetical protein